MSRGCHVYRIDGVDFFIGGVMEGPCDDIAGGGDARSMRCGRSSVCVCVLKRLCGFENEGSKGLQLNGMETPIC